jgi:hypothetical protein
VPAVRSTRFHQAWKRPTSRIDRPVLLPVDVEEEEPLVRALVLDLEARPGRERHREPAVEAPAVLRAHLQRRGHEVPAEPESDAEEVAERRLDRRRRLAVPERAQHGRPQLVRLVRQRHHRHPDVPDDPGPRDLTEHVRGPRRDGHAVDVPAAPIPRREPPARDVAQAGQVGERPTAEVHRVRW